MAGIVLSTLAIVLGLVGLIVWITWPQDVGRFDYTENGEVIDNRDDDAGRG